MQQPHKINCVCTFCLGEAMNKELFMKEAIKLAEKAALVGEVPVGAVVVRDEEIIARASNRRIGSQKTAAHAEMIAIKMANKKLGTWILEDCDIYVTLEPCPMCAGAIMQARMRKVYFGAFDKKAGALGSVLNLYEHAGFNHYPEAEGAVLERECSELLTGFFKKLRNKE